MNASASCLLSHFSDGVRGKNKTKHPTTAVCLLFTGKGLYNNNGCRAALVVVGVPPPLSSRPPGAKPDRNHRPPDTFYQIFACCARRVSNTGYAERHPTTAIRPGCISHLHGWVHGVVHRAVEQVSRSVLESAPRRKQGEVSRGRGPYGFVGPVLGPDREGRRGSGGGGTGNNRPVGSLVSHDGSRMYVPVSCSWPIPTTYAGTTRWTCTTTARSGLLLRTGAGLDARGRVESPAATHTLPNVAKNSTHILREERPERRTPPMLLLSRTHMRVLLSYTHNASMNRDPPSLPPEKTGNLDSYCEEVFD